MGKTHQKRIETALENVLLRASGGAPPKLSAALNYAVFPAGGRLRPRLLMAVAEACGAAASQAALTDAAAAAIELLHCASLVHDDLPCFDDADLRRGKPSVHRAYGQSTAVLVGDALIVLAFDALSAAAQGATSAGRALQVIGLLSQAVGSPSGIIAGQGWENEAAVELDRYHRTKTASMFEAALAGGAAVAGAPVDPWRRAGMVLGEAYQIADDIADVMQPQAVIGKTAQRDRALGRPSAVIELGIEGATERLNRRVEQAVAAIPPCPDRSAIAALFVAIATRYVKRISAAQQPASHRL